MRAGPSTTTVPAVGSSRPPTIRSSVVLPLPLGPRTVTISPAATVRSIGRQRSRRRRLGDAHEVDRPGARPFRRPLSASPHSTPRAALSGTRVRTRYVAGSVERSGFGVMPRSRARCRGLPSKVRTHAQAGHDHRAPHSTSPTPARPEVQIALLTSASPPDRAPPDAPQGPPQPARPADAGRPPPPHARLRALDRRRPLPRDHRHLGLRRCLAAISHPPGGRADPRGRRCSAADAVTGRRCDALTSSLPGDGMRLRCGSLAENTERPRFGCQSPSSVIP